MWHAARSKRKNREDHDEVGQVTIETGEIGLHLNVYCNRPFPPTFAIQREREKLRYWVGFFGVLSSPLKTAFGTIGNCRLRSH